MTKSYLTAVRLLSNRGFTLLESLIVLSILTTFLFISAVPINVYLYRDVQDNIVHTQTLVLFKRSEDTVNLDESIERYAPLRFNEKGNVLIAQTLRFNGNRKIVVMLGPGRIHE